MSTKHPHGPDHELVDAMFLVAEVDRLPGHEAAKRYGDPDVQRALEVIAKAKRHREEVAA